MNLVERALAFAAAAHGDQRRKYTHAPYIEHSVAVADLVASVGGTPAMVAAALLHDTLEDTDTTLETLQAEFGPAVAALVLGLTDVSRPEDGPRRVRKELDRQHLAQGSHEVQTIKLADLLDNTASILAAARSGNREAAKFAPVYLAEKALLLEVLTRGDAALKVRAWTMVDRGLA